MSIEGEGNSQGGLIELKRRNLAREPQIHAAKKLSVIFTDEGDKSVKRSDRC